jgi:hypothetical protein
MNGDESAGRMQSAIVVTAALLAAASITQAAIWSGVLGAAVS